MTPRRSDLALGLAVLVLSAAYLEGAARIPESLLSDAVGAAGLPRAVGWSTGVIGALLCVRSVLAAPGTGQDRPIVWKAHLRALGLLSIMAAYVLLAPWLGYAVATGLLIAGGAAYAGAPRNRNLVLIPALAALLFWLLFVVTFGIPMPGSPLFGST